MLKFKNTDLLLLVKDTDESKKTLKLVVVSS